MFLRDDKLVFSPSDLITYMGSPFASWMDHWHLMNPGNLKPDDDSAQLKMVQDQGNQHEEAELKKFRQQYPSMVEIERTKDHDKALQDTLDAMQAGAPLIYQAFLKHDVFAGWSDFIIRTSDGRYQVWDTKLARKPKPYYAVQLCCYTEMLRELIGPENVSDYYGVILGTGERVEFRVEDHFDYYLSLKQDFLAMHAEEFKGIAWKSHPVPGPRDEHRRWQSYADTYFEDVDHLVKVAGITSGNIKKLHDAGITTMEQLAQSGGIDIPKLSKETRDKLVHQASLQVQTRNARAIDEAALAVFDVIPPDPARNVVSGLSNMPTYDPADVYFDLEGYPMVPGGLEYLWGACYHDEQGALQFRDWWAHDSQQERTAFASFIDWVYNRWQSNPCMHVYHYAAYEVSVIRRLSTRYGTHQDKVDDLLRNEVFVDLYKVVAKSVRLGEDSYSIKKVELLYKGKRGTSVATAGDSIVEYARYIETHGTARPPYTNCKILEDIRDYNEDDCRSTYDLAVWLRTLATDHNIDLMPCRERTEEQEPSDKALARQQSIAKRQNLEMQLREQNTEIATTLADVIDFHRREEKPVWWAYFDRLTADEQEHWLDGSCIAGATIDGAPVPVARSFSQRYAFDPAQECKLSAGSNKKVMFAHEPHVKLEVYAIDTLNGTIDLKASPASIAKFSTQAFPTCGSLVPDEYVSPAPIPEALTEVCASFIAGSFPASAHALLTRTPPRGLPQRVGEDNATAAERIASGMDGECLIIQGPPGTGKTYTAGRVITALLQQGMKVGITSNGHKAIMNLVGEVGKSIPLQGCKAAGDGEDPLFAEHPGMVYEKSNSSAYKVYQHGIIAGTAWLFAIKDWEGELDYLFIDEAGQVSLANALAMSRCARNIVLMGDQMQLEQPIQGSHPGDASLSVLQYYLKDESRSKPSRPMFHAVVSPDQGLFLGTSHRMHPDICRVVSSLVYEGRLQAQEDCSKQRVALPQPKPLYVKKEHGIVFSNVQHDGNTQQSIEEVDRIEQITQELLGRTFTDKSGRQRTVTMKDILYIAPYNAQVRMLRDRLGADAQVGSVDKFQGLEAPICILSVCSSFGEYGARGLKFILDANRINVAISRAQCLAIVVGDGRICSTSVANVDELKLVNAFCKIVREGR